MYPYYESDWSILPPENNRRFSPGISITSIKQAINETIESGILRKQTPIRLRELIRQIRSASTAAEERAVVNTECAYIRSTFRDEDSIWKCRNMAKLLYIHMLGYPAHFGQLECLKLAASPKYTDKRIGYLGAMLLLDERQDVHLLITNSLKNDLNSPVQFIVGIGLCTLGAIASPMMAKDLAGEVEKLMLSSNTYLRKKAILCAFRMVKRAPDLIEMFIPPTITFLSDKNHGILISAITLITEMCEKNLSVLIFFKSITPSLVKILKNLIVSGYSPDHAVNGISDPFLQIKILKLLSILGRNDTLYTEAMNDVLAQVATNTDTGKNAGNAVLYETVLAIMNIKSEQSLRVLAVNILGRFLLNSDKNIRYIALKTLVRTVHSDITAIQRHRATILECLKDPDVTIQKCALELAFSLINEQNVCPIIEELLEFLEKADPEFKAICSSRIVLSAEHYSPSIHWHLDTLLSVLSIAGNCIRDDVISSTIQLISNSPPSEQQFITNKMWEKLGEIKNYENNQPLIKVAIWAIGEFGEHNSFDAKQLVGFYWTLLWSPQLSVTTKQYLLVSLAKISVKVEECKEKIQEIMLIFGCHLDVDLQQRAIEFSQLFTKYDHLRTSLLERMPVMQINKTDNEHNSDFVSVDDSSEDVEERVQYVEESNQSILLDLLGGNTTTSEIEGHETQTFSSINSNASNLNSGQDFMDLLGLTTNVTSVPCTSTAQVECASITVFDKDDIDLKLICKKENNCSIITAITRNKSLNIFDKYILQAAIPKSYDLAMLPPSSTVLLPGETVKQDMRITRNNKAVLKMKIRITYDIDNYSTFEHADVNCFPNDLFD